jgi:hypothetical protein
LEEAARIADWQERLCTMEMVYEDLFQDVERIRKKLGQ